MQFFMNGKPISTPMRFRKYFDPRDLLRSRELAAGFLLHHFRYISPLCLYHCEVFYAAATRQLFCHPRPDPEIYRAYELFLSQRCSYDSCNFVKEHLCTQKPLALRNSLWNLTAGTSLPEEDRICLFLMLTAAYHLANQTLETCPLTPQEAEDAYLRKPPAETVFDPWVVFDDSGEDICLPATEEPYKILMDDSARELVAQGHPITIRRIVALPHSQGDATIPLTIEFYRRREEPPFRQIKVAVDDFRYFNFVKNIPVHYHPRMISLTDRAGQTFRLSREGKNLIFTTPRSRQTMPIADGFAIYGFALEKNGAGFILLTSDGVKYNNYSRRNEYFYLPGKNIVQVAFREDECLLLDKNGRVHSLDGGHKFPYPVIRLDALLQK